MWFPFTFFAVFLYALTNVLDSALVAKYSKSPLFLMWVITCFTVLILFIIALTHDVSTSWVPTLLLCGLLSYAGDWFFFWLLDRFDISVVNAGWALQAVFMSIIGFTVFHELWTLQQCIGAVFVLAGVLFLSFFHVHGTLGKTFLFLSLLGAIYLPLMVARKAALLAGQPILAVFFWLMVGRDAAALLVPLLFREKRIMIWRTVRECNVEFFFLCVLVGSAFLAAEYYQAKAYAVGPVSLISVVTNVQPFLVMALAALLAFVRPSLAPRELLTARSTSIKVASFSVVFIGLALLALSQ